MFARVRTIIKVKLNLLIVLTIVVQFKMSTCTPFGDMFENGQNDNLFLSSKPSANHNNNNHDIDSNSENNLNVNNNNNDANNQHHQQTSNNNNNFNFKLLFKNDRNEKENELTNGGDIDNRYFLQNLLGDDEDSGGGGGGGGDGSDDSEDMDDSVFGNRDESFFDFASRRVNELQNINRNLFLKSINQCEYSPIDTNEHSSNHDVNNKISDNDSELEEDINKRFLTRSIQQSPDSNCILASVSLDTFLGKTSDKLFLYDMYTVGLISSSDSTLRFYYFNIYQRTLNLLRTKYFRGEVPYDACTDKFKNIYVVFPDQNKIGKYILNQTTLLKSSNRQHSSTSSVYFNKKSNKTQFIIRELNSIKDTDFRPSTVACHDDLIYVSERSTKNHIRIYDKALRLVRIITLDGVVVSNHHAMAVNQNVRVLIDGLDTLALFNPQTTVTHQSSSSTVDSNHNRTSTTNQNSELSSSSSSPSIFNIKHRKKYSLVPENNKVTVCHFYSNMNCLEDVSLQFESRSKSFIYVADSCENDIKRFLFKKNEKIVLEENFKFTNGIPVSMVSNQLGYLFVLTDLPRKITIINQRECVSSQVQKKFH